MSTATDLGVETNLHGILAGKCLCSPLSTKGLYIFSPAVQQNYKEDLGEWVPGVLLRKVLNQHAVPQEGDFFFPFSDLPSVGPAAGRGPKWANSIKTS